jgi:2-octaprenyl-6-methoxyphenol hydroxylase
MARSARSQKDADPPLLIAGGGHAGLLLALAIDRAGVPVTLIEAQPIPEVLEAPFDGRALALMYGSKRVFDALGLWPALADATEPVWGVRVEDQSSGARVAYEALEVGRHPFGYGIENRVLRARLLAAALARSGIDVVAPARLARIERGARDLIATLADGRRIATGLLIGADGRGSQVRELAGLGVDRWSYPQSALTFALRHERSHGGRVREYLRPPGPIALLPLERNHCAVTWIERHAVAERLLRLDPDRLLAELCERIGDQLTPVGICGRPIGHALSAHRARRFVGPRVALIGDAAHGVHPIHAQGFNLGVRDVAALAEVLVEARRQGLDLGSGEVLIRYDRWRRTDTRLVLGLTDGLNRLFSSDLAPARLIRGMGLSALGWLAPLRHLAMRRGMGLAGDLPKLARGDAL